MQQRFAGKVALVTGASSGIGKVTALEFAREGARVVVAARRRAESEQVVDQIKMSGGEAAFVQTDVERHASIKALLERTIELYGRLDCAFNNAGIAGDVFKPTADHSEENWDQVLDVNLKGTWLCMKYELAQMLKQGGGTIVNNSSVYGLKIQHGRPHALCCQQTWRDCLNQNRCARICKPRHSRERRLSRLYPFRDCRCSF